MRHRIHGRRLNRNSGQRKALLKNLITDLICYEKIVTTEAKARTLRPAAEKMITLAKRGITNGQSDPAKEVHARRLAAARLNRVRVVEDDAGELVEVDVVQQLFSEIAPRFMERNGGYTRMVKLGKRPGDNADMAVLMLVGDNEGSN
ncbi:MAG: 50S ribosomal protein L17 [Anaerolineales bacterium]|nr:50S ribosomal protein L17 [Anaerolineales bacterium]MCB0013759.1 50S ribosomal protein L17 [Anaerolineales bacterium]MCB0017521.1 50S ribosomal protein L17 [Anaerolineales bacterium]MCB0029778.1 50S ribosomal protein L17 [Anaerolineales bacterium]